MRKKLLPIFKEGDVVTWETTGGGYFSRRKGVVVTIIPAGKDPRSYIENTVDFYKAYSCNVPTFPREHESYLVMVSRQHKQTGEELTPIIFYPKVGVLRKYTL